MKALDRQLRRSRPPRRHGVQKPLLPRLLPALLVALLLHPAAPDARAASTGAVDLLTVQGAGTPTNQGEFVASTQGLDAPFRFFIEVPPGTPQLVVQFFDADVGAGGGGEAGDNRDRARGGFDTSVTLRAFDPAGTLVAQATLGPGACGFCDDAWAQFAPFASPVPGHWEVQIDQSGSETGGNDINAIGLRAHDGTAGAGGTELNVYYLSQGGFGANPGFNRTYDLHPYVTSGCRLDSNDFDLDSAGSTTHSSRSGSFSQTLPVSGNDVWLQAMLSGWTSDFVAGDYGIWSTAFTVDTFGDSGNYGHLYLGSFQAAPPPPGANPEPDTFRVYLPTDAGQAPTKPYLEQLLTSRSPTDLEAGQTSRLTITLRMVNPAPFPITFSPPGQVVTARVPGGEVVYAGVVDATPGTTVVSEPAQGGSGDVVWNPGVVAPGQTVILAYDVDVTPASAGFVLPVTGTPPGATGTTATFLDETGVQAFTFGPLCDLRVRDDALTHAAVVDLRARDVPEGVELRWTTASEAGTAGFRILRRRASEPGRSPLRSWEPVHEGLLEALPASPQGGVYRFLDRGAALGTRAGETEYLLVEVETGGREVRHGPFRISAGDPSEPFLAPALAPVSDFSSRPRRPASGELARSPERDLESAAGALAAAVRPRRGRQLLIETLEEGLHRVPAADLAGALGLSPALVRAMLRSGRWELTQRGEPVAWTPVLGSSSSGPETGPGPGAGATEPALVFYAEQLDSPFTLRNAYRLRPGFRRGLIMEREGKRTPRPGEPSPEGFPELLRFEEDLLPAAALPLDPDGDFWFWTGLNASRAAAARTSFELRAPEATGGGDANLVLELQGASSAPHRLVVRAAGLALGETSFEGLELHRATFPLPADLLIAETPLEVEVEARQEPGAPASQVFVDALELAYRRSLRTANDALEVTADAGSTDRDGTLTVELQPRDAAATGAIALDLTDPRRPAVLRSEVVARAGGVLRVTFEPPHPDGHYLVTTARSLHPPAALVPAGGPDPLAPGHRGEYLVIAPEALAAAAQSLVELRAAEGLEAHLVTLEEIRDRVGDGIADPRAVRDFLAAAMERWEVPPRWVLLVGAGTLDPRDLLGAGGHLFPVLLTSTPRGLFASDARFADFDGDGLAELAVGRLPARTPGEVLAYAGKLAAYEGARGADWTGVQVVVSDDADAAGDFRADAEALAGLLPAHLEVRSVALADGSAADARDALFGALADGTGWLTYVGHGALDRMAAEGLLTSADATTLDTGGRPPVVVALTCTLSRFEVPGFPALGPELVRGGGDVSDGEAPGGAVAVWAPSGLSDSRDAALLGDRLLRAIHHPPAEGGSDRPTDGVGGGTPPRLGDAIRRALDASAELGISPHMLAVYNLLGDPALRLQMPPVPRSPDPSPDSGE